MKLFLFGLALAGAGAHANFLGQGTADMWDPNARQEAEQDMEARAKSACAPEAALQVTETQFAIVPRSYPTTTQASAEFSCVLPNSAGN